MVNLHNSHQIYIYIYIQFIKGHFAVWREQNVFSALAIDQCHIKANELLKGDSGAVRLIENPHALERWMVPAPEISRVVLEFEKRLLAINEEKSHRHHEQ